MVKSFKGWILAGLAGVAAIVLASCNPRDYRTEATQVPQLLNSILSDPKTFNYALSNESPNVFTLTSEGLISENMLTSAIDPALAEVLGDFAGQKTNCVHLARGTEVVGWATPDRR